MLVTVTCLNCNKEFEKKASQIKRSPNNYCSRSCAATVNNKKFVKRKKKYTRHTRTCRTPTCRNIISYTRKKCDECIESNRIRTLGEAKDNQGRARDLYRVVRARSRAKARKLGWNQCCVCGYNKTYQVCHIKSISEFDDSALIDEEINHESNIRPLCPNCHWELDHGLLELE